MIDVETPLGLLWSGETLFVSSKAGVDADTGFDGRRFSGHRVVVALPDGTGESNGLTLAPDGRIHMGSSAPCDHCGTTLPYSAAIVSFRADGTDVRVDARGIRAPIGLSYYPGTSDLFVTMNQRDDLGAKTPGDWLAVVRPGDDWGFPNCYGQGGAACAGAPRPVATLDQHAAVSGVAILTGQLGPSIGNATIVVEWAKGLGPAKSPSSRRVAGTRGRSRPSSPASRTPSPGCSHHQARC